MSRSFAALAVFAMTSVAVPASAASIVIDINSTGADGLFGPGTIQGFDPALGTLNRVVLSLTGEYVVTYRNPTDSPAKLSNGAGFSVTFFTLSLSGEGRLETTLDPGESMALRVSDSGSVTISDGLDIFQNDGPIDFFGFGGAAAGIDGPFDVIQSGSLTGRVTYKYSPARAVPEPATISLLASSAAATLARRRRRPRGRSHRDGFFRRLQRSKRAE